MELEKSTTAAKLPAAALAKIEVAEGLSQISRDPG